MRWILMILFVFSVSQALFGQPIQVAAPVDEKKLAEMREKRQALSEQILADVGGLRLPENRAFVLARTGGILWKTDQENAKNLFQRAVGELMTAQGQAELETKGRSNQNELRVIQNVRPAVLNLIANFDAVFALDSLYQSRTPVIQRALAAKFDDQAKASEPSNMSSYLAQMEINLEQRLLGLAAQQNPELAAKLLQETIKKGLSSETLSLLKKLFEKDPETANSLAAETMDKLLSSGFSNDPTGRSEATLALAILNDYIRPKKLGTKELKFEDMQIRSLANRLVSASLSQDTRQNPWQISAMIKIAEKLSPASVTALKTAERRNRPPGMPNLSPSSDSQRILDNRSLPPAQMIAEARKLPAENRNPVYLAAANKMAQSGDLNGARDLLNANLSGTSLDMALASLNMYYSFQLINQGKWAEAERLIDEMPESNRNTALIGLATRAYAKNPTENKDYAVSVLNKVRSTMPQRPTNQQELTQFMQLASAFAGIDADEGFGSFDPVIPMLNELADASAIVQGFQNNFTVRSGEFMIVNNANYGFQFDQTLLKTLAKSDFERTGKLIDRFTRPEIRVALKLQLAETGLN